MQQSVLIIIDVQQAFDDPFWGERNNLQAEKNIAALLTAWREQQAPVIHVKHDSTNLESPLHPDHTGNQFKPEVRPLDTELIMSKSVNSAFIGTDLESYLLKHGFMDVVIVGLTTDHCVSTTTRMAANLGFQVTLVSDATATFAKTGPDGVAYSAEEIHRINLASLHGEFCTVTDTNSVLNSHA